MTNSQITNRIETLDKPVVVGFWAAWCTACKTAMPILRELATDYADRVDFVVVDAGASREVAARYRVMATPTVLALHRGREVGRVAGARPREHYRQIFEAAAQGVEADVPIGSFDRAIRLGAGGLFLLLAVVTSSWVLGIVGVALAFYGIHDRCPVWRAIVDRWRRWRAS